MKIKAVLSIKEMDEGMQIEVKGKGRDILYCFAKLVSELRNDFECEDLMKCMAFGFGIYDKEDKA